MTPPDYNTQRPLIILKEYGRNVQKLVEYIRNNPNKDKRTEMAYTLIELIKQLTPTIKDQPENPQRVWDDLYIIADFNLDINSPFPIPAREVIFKKPERVGYPQSQVRFKHYGKNIEKLVKEALKIEDPQGREEAILYLGKLMKTFYGNWNKETIDDSVILKDIQEMSGGALKMSIEKIREENLFEKLYKERKKVKTQGGERGERGERNERSGGGQRHSGQGGSGGGGGQRHFNKGGSGGGGHKGNNFRRRRDA